MGAERAEEILSRPGITRERIRAFLREAVDSDLAQPVRRGCMAVNTAAELGGQDPGITRALRAM
jgi:TetR/AcrR family transcriptional repressor of nem operon